MNSYELLVAGMVFSLLIAFAVVLFYFRYRRHLTQQQLEISRAEIIHQKELLQAVIQSQEEERKRIGMNLHDEVGSALSALRMLTERDDVISGDNRNWVPQCKTIIDRVITDVRNISHDLSPLRSGTYDFIDALDDLCEAINLSGKLRINLNVAQHDELKKISDSNGLALYRVLSELISNTIKHSGASSISIEFSQEPGHVNIEYRDNGTGLLNIHGQKKGIGFRNIESRLNVIGAVFTIDETPGGFGMKIKTAI